MTAGINLTLAKMLVENKNTAFQGDIKDGPFEIPDGLAKRLLDDPNPHGKSNSDVVVPWINGSHLTGRPANMWIIDFGVGTPLGDAALYSAPFQYVQEHVKPKRDKNRDRRAKEHWWLHIRPRPEMRNATAGLPKLLCTPRVSKFRLFVWIPEGVLADSATFVFARDDDYFFGVLHSAVHERWSRRMGTQLREAESGCRYTPTTCFETFPFPPLSGGIAKEIPTDRGFSGAPKKYDPQQVALLRERIAEAARKLNDLRENWLNPKSKDGSPQLYESQLKKRTLTNLYNERATWLELAHLELDRAVLAAYGWPEEWAEKLQPGRDEKGRINPILGVADESIEQAVLERLLELNQAMSSPTV